MNTQDVMLGDAETSGALTKAQLADLLFDQLGVSKREAKDMVDAYFDLISGSLVRGEEVKLSSFGNFRFAQGTTPWPQPSYRGVDPDRRPSCGDFPRQQQAQGADPGLRQMLLHSFQ